MINDIDILIYIKNIKEFFEKNKDAKQYFIPNNNERLFYYLIELYSYNNKMNNMDHVLNKKQFEKIRDKIIENKHIVYFDNTENFKIIKK